MFYIKDIEIWICFNTIIHNRVREIVDALWLLKLVISKLPYIKLNILYLYEYLL